MIVDPPIAVESSRGFTLIEVLAALVIVSLGMLGVISAVGQTASNTTYLRDKTLAHWIAMNKLTEVRLQRAAPKVDKTSDEVEMAGRKWRWTMVVEQTPVESIRRIDINVRPEDAPADSSLAFISGFYGTAVGAPGTPSPAWDGGIGAGGGGPDGDDSGDDDNNDDDDDGRDDGQDPPADPPEDPGTDPGEGSEPEPSE